MSSTRGDIPALESGLPTGLFTGLSSPIGISRRAFSYDQSLDAPLHSPPPDLSVNILWKDPVIPHHRFTTITEEDGSDGARVAFETAAVPKSPVVKTRATTLMSSLMIRQSQESLQKFEHQTGLTDTVYSPHKGLSAEGTRYHCLAEGTLPKLRMPSGDFKEDRLTTSAQSTPSVTPSVTPCVSPHASPSVSRRTWFNLSSTSHLAAPELSSPNPSTDMGGNEGRGGDRWSFFGTRPVVQKSPTDPGSDSSPGFTLQSYLGLQKSTTMEGIKTQVKAEDPANFMPPKIEISGIEAKRAAAAARPHKLKPRDMNVLTPSGF